MAENDALARDIFGGSDSELSSDDERPTREAVRSLTPSDGEGGDDDYIERDRPGPGAGKAVKKKKKKVRGAEDGEKRERKRKRTTAKKDPYADIDLNELPPEQAAKIRLNQKIEAALKSGRSRSSAALRSKRKKNDEQILDSFADDEVARLRESMNAAADEDYRNRADWQQNRGDKLPAMAKLKMLNEVIEVLRKGSLAQSIIDNNLLEAVKRWLEPLPDRSLPALNIQRELFILLKKMEFIDSSVLKESGLGPIVLFYTKCQRVQPGVRRNAEELITTWSRPIIKSSASHRDKVIPIASMDVDDGTGSQTSQSQRLGLNAILAKAREEEKDKVKRNAVAIPQATRGNYTTAPASHVGLSRKSNQSVDDDVQRRKKNAERLRTLTRKIKAPN